MNDRENYTAGYSAQRLSTPGKHAEAYRRGSPIHIFNKFKDKLLIVLGMVDAVQLTGKLVRKRRDFAHIFYPQESHGFIGDESWILR